MRSHKSNKNLKPEVSMFGQYDHKMIEKRWQKQWEQNGTYESDVKSADKPFYNLMMFPYPSALGLHVGNIYAFVGSDVYGRFTRMKGFDTFEPIGLDGFGIHSENFALKIGEHPLKLSKKTEKNIYGQLRAIGNSYAWSAKLETYAPDYYKWTQWIFVQMFKAGLAYRATASVNWCPSCKTVLADEQVVAKQLTIDNKQLTKHVCERCGTEVEKKQLTQWFFGITNYAERLLTNIDKLDWSENVKVAQTNWLGKSEGVKVMFPSDIKDNTSVEVFTTRPDTIFGVTYLALAPKHQLVTTIISKAKGSLGQSIQKYIDYSQKTANQFHNRQKAEGKDTVKSGIFTGFYATNPLNKKQVPVYIADYVLMEYGTGAIMGVPAHDERDRDFANKHDIDIVEVVRPVDASAKNNVSQVAFTGEGRLINSGQFNGMDSISSIKSITKYIKDNQLGSTEVMWHLRDWIISRQRYWGAPIPMIFCGACADRGKSWFTTSEAKSRQKVHGYDNWAAGWYPVGENQLPVELPYIENFKPTGTGTSPLASDPEFVRVKCPECGNEAERETDVSDTFLDSAWYFLRYPSVNAGPVSGFHPASARSKRKSKGDQLDNVELRAVGNPPTAATRGPRIDLPWDPEITKKWLPVDMYIGGAEHAVLHLLYSRFLTMVFYDLGLIDFEEPFSKFRAHGLLIADGAKMSKSKGNVVNPDEFIDKYGADTLRCYLMFCGRFDQGGDFRDTGIEGMSRFLRRVWRLVKTAGPVSSFLPAFAKASAGRPVSEDSAAVPLEAKRSAVGNPSTSATRVSLESLYLMHKTIKKVTEDLETLDYNTAISAIMEWVNALEKRIVDSQKQKTVSREPVTRDEVENLLLLLAPFVPHMTEELWQSLKSSKSQHPKSKFESIHTALWPEFDPKLSEASKITLVIQVNGKVRDRIEVERGLSEEKAKELALNAQNSAKFLGKKRPKKIIYVKERLINFVT